jgi:hypothetical protein
MLGSPEPALQPHVPLSLRSARIELIDLRSILPWDVETVAESVNRTGRLVIVHEAGMTAGVGAEISAEIQKRCFLKLQAPVKRVTGWEYVLYFITRPYHVTEVRLSVPPSLCSTRSSTYQMACGSLTPSWRHYPINTHTHTHTMAICYKPSSD